MLLFKFKSGFRTVCFVLLLLSGGCLQVGLPEFVSSGGLTDSGVGFSEPYRNGSGAGQGGYRARLLAAVQRRAPLVALELPNGSLAARTNPTGLGHQFLLGFIPFTSVYLQHDPNSLLIETVVEQLLRDGFRVALYPEGSGRVAGRRLPDAILTRLRFSELRVNAFDLLILRSADIDGSVQIDFSSPFNPDEPVKRLVAPVEVNEFRRLAHAPALAALLERSTFTAMEGLGGKLPSARQLRWSDAPNGGLGGEVGDAPLLILSPRFVLPPAAAAGTSLAQSYGYQSRPAFSNTALLRIVQRGLEQGAIESEKAFISFPHQLDLGSGAPSGTDLALQTAVTKLEATDDVVKLGLKLTLVPGHSEECLWEIEAVSEMDGGLVVAVERAAAAAVKKLFGGAAVEGMVCGSSPPA